MKAIDRIMKAISDKSLKPSKVEKDLHLSNGYLSTMFKRKSEIGESTLIKLSNYLDFSLHYLLTGSENEHQFEGQDTKNVFKEIIELQREVIRLQKEMAILKDNRNKSRKYTPSGTIPSELNEPKDV